MTNEQILKRVLDQAEKNGYKHNWMGDPDRIGMFNSTKGYFSHDFAKAFWEGERYCWYCDAIFLGDAKHYCGDGPASRLKPNWQYHLREMVLEEDPLKYLEQFLKKESEE